jgi:CubicO group peptidase (beta-lactamase class C family)
MRYRNRGVLVALILAGLPVPAPLPTVTATQPVAIDDVRAAAAELPELRSLLVSWRGGLVAEYYGTGVRPGSLANVKSASKSVIAALVGIAIERRMIRTVDEPIATYFPELAKDPDPRKRAITVEDLLTMRSGLQSTSGVNYGRWVKSPNWVRFALQQPMVSEPGTAMEYSTGSSHLLSAILTKVSRTSTLRFAQDTLATPLGFRLAGWPRDPQGIYFGGNEMLLTPKQMVAIGELYLNRGRVKGRQIIPSAWVDSTCVPRTTSVWDADRHYGYGWWIQNFDRHAACFAWGYGGQYILVFRELNLVVVATSATGINEERRGHRRRLFELIEQRVLAPVSAAQAGGSQRPEAGGQRPKARGRRPEASYLGRRDVVPGPRPPASGLLTYRSDPSQLISHGIPKRSTSTPKRAAQNVFSSGMTTLPSLASS